MSLTPMEQELTVQAALVPDGPNGLGRPTHVFVDHTNNVLVAWPGHAIGDPSPQGRWTVLCVGRWHAEWAKPFEPVATRHFKQITLAPSSMFPHVLDLGYIALRIERESQRLAEQRARVSNTVHNIAGGQVVQARDIDGVLDLPFTVQGDRLSDEQEAILERMWPLISRLAEDIPRSFRSQTVIAVPRTWPQLLHWEGYPVRRMPVARPALLVFGPDVDAPVDDV